MVKPGHSSWLEVKLRRIKQDPNQSLQSLADEIVKLVRVCALPAVARQVSRRFFYRSTC